MTATELPKGSIYRRFKIKKKLFLLPTTKVVRLCGVIFIKQWKIKTAIDKILAIFLVYQDAANNPPIAGGCPLLNSAIESTGVFPELQQQQKAMMIQ